MYLELETKHGITFSSISNQARVRNSFFFTLFYECIRKQTSNNPNYLAINNVVIRNKISKNYEICAIYNHFVMEWLKIAQTTPLGKNIEEYKKNKCIFNLSLQSRTENKNNV